MAEYTGRGDPRRSMALLWGMVDAAHPGTQARPDRRHDRFDRHRIGRRRGLGRAVDA